MLMNTLLCMHFAWMLSDFSLFRSSASVITFLTTGMESISCRLSAVGSNDGYSGVVVALFFGVTRRLMSKYSL